VIIKPIAYDRLWWYFPATNVGRWLRAALSATARDRDG
jgi:hypothetical protein